MTSLLFAIFGSRKVGLSGASWASAAAETKSRGAKHILRPASAAASNAARGSGRAVGRGARRVAGAAGTLALKPIDVGSRALARRAEKVSDSTRLNTLANQGGVKGYFGEKILDASTGLSNAGGLQDIRKAKTEKYETRYTNLGKLHGKEQKVQDDRDVAKYAHDEAAKKLRDTQKKIKDIDSDEEKIYRDLMSGLKYTPDQKDKFLSLEREIKTLEKQKKKGTLSAAETKNLEDAKRGLKEKKQSIRLLAKTDPSVDKNLVTRANNTFTEKKNAEVSVTDLRSKELSTGNTLKSAETRLKVVDEGRKKRQEDYANKIRKKIKSVTTETMDDGVEYEVENSGSLSGTTQEAASTFINNVRTGNVGGGGSGKKGSKKTT